MSRSYFGKILHIHTDINRITKYYKAFSNYRLGHSLVVMFQSLQTVDELSKNMLTFLQNFLFIHFYYSSANCIKYIIKRGIFIYLSLLMFAFTTSLLFQHDSLFHTVNRINLTNRVRSEISIYLSQNLDIVHRWRCHLEFGHMMLVPTAMHFWRNQHQYSCHPII